MTRKSLTRFGAAIVVGVLLCAGGWFLLRAAPGIRVGTAVVSHTLCSAVFVSGLDPDQVYTQALKPNPGQAILAKRLHYVVDRQSRQVTATWAGVFESRAVYRDGLGCTLASDFRTHKLDMNESPGVLEKSLTALTTAKTLEASTSDPKLEEALDRAFSEANRTSARRVKAIVILHHGKIVAERYATGFGVDTPILGYSLAKSVTNALVGILVRHGKLSVEQLAPVPAWGDPADPRHAITIDQLLRMTSGLALEESDTGFDPVSRMLFREPDMAAFAESAHLKAAPGSQWEYTSGNTLILSRIIRDTVGGRAQDVLDFAQRELFGPLGITTATMEFDATGTPVGSIYTYMSARDWARFGQLYLNDGVFNRQRVLPEGWVKYSASPTLDTDYGAGFWTNRGAHGDAKDRIEAGMPEDAFYGSGNLGQRLVVIPSSDLVIVRLGFTFSPGFDMKGLLQLIAEASSTLKNP